MTELASSKRVRSSIVGLLTRQRNSFDAHREELSVSGITVMSNLIDDYYKRYTVVSEKINELSAGNNAEEENAVQRDEEFAESYVSLKTELLELLEERKPKGDPLNTTFNSSRSVKLPKLELPKFSGQYHNWVDFKNEFQSMILEDASLNDIDRFRFLKSALTEAPRMIISNMEISEENFRTAWKALCDRYDNASLIFRSHINQLLSLQGASGSSSQGCRTLLDKAQAHYRSLAALGSAQEIADNFLITIIMSKLDSKAQSKWEEQATTKIASWDEFSKFLERYSISLERLGQNQKQQQHATVEKSGSFGKKPKTNTVLTSTNKTECPKCRKSDHTILKCPVFAALTPSARFDEAKALKLCIACLVSEHSSRFCKGRCSKCSRRHHELLHFPERKSDGDSKSGDNLHTSLLAARFLKETQVLLASVTVMVYDNVGDLVPCNAVLDSGSTDHYMSDRFARLVNAPRTRCDTLSGGIGSCVVQSKGKCTIAFTSRFGTSRDFTINPTILQRVTGAFPPDSFEVDGWTIPPHLSLADPNFNVPKHIDLLIGGGLFWRLLTLEKIELGPDLPMLFGTDIGWIVVGPYVPSFPSQTSLLARSCADTEDFHEAPSLDELVNRFWEVDSFSDTSAIPLKPADQSCEDQYALSTRRDESGRYFVRLPFKSDPSKLGKSLDIATRRFLNLERKLDRQPDVKQQYSDFIREYEQLGHLEVLSDFNLDEPHCFLPHHCVLKPTSSSTKLRVVFDASCKTSNGISLNDTLHPGPKLQNDLFITLLRFRLHPFVATADIQKMYRQVYIDPPDSNFQLILWRNKCSEPLKILRLRTVTYGTAPGAYLSIRTLYKLAEDEGKDFPEGARFLRECFYVDDAMIGAETVESLKSGLKQLTELLGRGRFRLSKFCSNSTDVLVDIPPESQEKFLTIDDHSIVKALGMIWQPDLDVFRFTVKPTKCQAGVTKRAVLSEVAKVFDPLGFLCPVVAKVKVFLQLLWKLRPKLDWDTPLPSEISELWLKFVEELVAIKDVVIPRFVYDGARHKSIQIHGFSDASEMAYGACVYVRVVHVDGHVSAHLLTAKSRVAPTKTLTIARLELCAATMLYDLVQRLSSEVFHETPIDEVFYWTDSSIVLSWLNAPASSWATFVAHRVARIQANSTIFQWCHVPSESNPADLVSRGLSATELVSCELWWKGPRFLREKHVMFPDQFVLPGAIEDVEEFRPVKRVLLTHKVVDLTGNMRFPYGYRGACRSFAYVLRFIDRCRNPTMSKAQRKRAVSDLDSLVRQSAPTVEQEIQGEEALIRVVQRSRFHAEYSCLVRGTHVPSDSPLRNLAPFVDDDTGLLRVGGRLRHCDIPIDAKHQILLPKDHVLTRLLFTYYHQSKLFHAGPQTVLMAIRSRYWPIGGLQLARAVVSKCVWCFRMHPKLMSQLMGQLPRDRTVPQDIKPFVVSGVDFAGPLKVRHHIRCKQQKEVHLALFVCFVTKAVHIELVPDRSTEAFV